MIRLATAADAAKIAEIYNHYIANTVVTFEEQPVEVDAMAERVTDVLRGGLPWLVLETVAGVQGYAYACPWRPRIGYRFSVETSVYLAPGSLGHGYGQVLYTDVLDRLRARPVHVVLGGIALPNAASVALHERLGFEQVAHLRQVGYKFERWIDVGYWQLTLA